LNKEISRVSKYRRQYIKPIPITTTTIKTFFENVLFDDEDEDIAEYNMNIDNKQGTGIFNIIPNKSKRQVLYEKLDTENKDVYEYDDIYNMHIDGEYIVEKEFSKENNNTNNKQSINKNVYDSPIVSPYKFIEFFGNNNKRKEEVQNFYKQIQQIQTKEKRSDLVKTNGQLFLDIGKIHGNVIYVCVLDEVLDTIQKQVQIQTQIKEEKIEETVIHLYYPYLESKKIDINNYYTQRERLIEQTEELWQKKQGYYNIISDFYNIYDSQSNNKLSNSKLTYVSKGIKSITSGN
jgi:hypothetical protein